MKFLTYEYNKKEYPAVMNLENEKIYSLDEIFGIGRFNTLIDFIRESTEDHLKDIESSLKEKVLEGKFLHDVNLLSPIPKPIHDIICVGVNYADHLKEAKSLMKDKNHEETMKPVYFSKRAIRIMGPNEDIKGEFELDNEFDYEVELAVIIGKEGRDIPKERVEEHVFGYSIFNDLTSRKLQREHNQWYKGKSLDGYSVMGPVILHKSQIPFPFELDVISRINGESRQHSNTKMFINDITKLVSDFSKGITLEAGDIIATGTPAGVGMGFEPKKYIKKGDLVECEIPGIGLLKNLII